MIKTKDSARQGSCFKKQKQNQQLSYQKRNKLPDKKLLMDKYILKVQLTCISRKKKKTAVLLPKNKKIVRPKSF